nr:MAG TPA: tail sheath protein [Bacteriophage sp.]
MANNARGVHVSPGIYGRDIDLTYAVKSLGITTTGLVGETLRGPAFQVMDVHNWREYQDTFGGTSTKKFKGSQYPKYELPYIAKSYLSESEQLKVVRVLGLSGYNAGPAWLITADQATVNEGHQGSKMVVAVLRSRGSYRPYMKSTSNDGTCICTSNSYDVLSYNVGEMAANKADDCKAPRKYNMGALQIKPYVPLYSLGNECSGFGLSPDASSYFVNTLNYGRFKLAGFTGAHTEEELTTLWKKVEGGEHPSGYFEYPVSLNPSDKEYILNVLGNTAEDGDAPIFVETLYDVSLQEGIVNGNITSISAALEPYQVYYTSDYNGLEAVSGLVKMQEEGLSRRYVGLRYLADKSATLASTDGTRQEIHAHPYNYITGLPLTYEELASKKLVKDKASVTIESIPEKRIVGKPDQSKFNMETEEGKAEYKAAMQKPAKVIVEAGQIYTVSQYTGADGKRRYFYAYNLPESVELYEKDWKSKREAKGEKGSVLNTAPLFDKLRNPEEGATTQVTKRTLVKNSEDGMYWRMNTEGDDITFVSCDLNNYKSAYRYASTPWIVSNLKGDYNKMEVNRLFRFHTISDGNSSNNEVKVSVENIRPDEGTFDVVVRDIHDTDESPKVLERFGKCSMIPGQSDYIAYRIGSFDGVYESKSKFVTVEVNESTATRTSVPAGFLGYPQQAYSGSQVLDGNNHADIVQPKLRYNLDYDEEVKNRKQYFGLSSWVGIDIDMFTFKGNAAYVDGVPSLLSNGFHLDSRINPQAFEDKSHVVGVTVDGDLGYKFDAVSTNARTRNLSETPVIGTEQQMAGSIYENVNMRKFTVYFYGGFDGWDVYREKRTNTDEFKLSRYKGTYDSNSGAGYAFDKIQNPNSLKLNQNGITSDWYAYLSAIRQFANPEETDINVFATPGIDYVNQKLLVEEAIEMIEEERADSIYVVTTPDKPSGAGDYTDEMYSADDVVYNLEDTEIDSNYACTYYPWVKYYDKDNNQYIYLPATKDAVRNFAQTDNQYQPWFAPAGTNRGNVECVRAKTITKISDEDRLYDGRINPVKTFATDGVKIWGQKNLQKRESQLNRIAVRRLLLRLRKLISISCIGLIFDPNDVNTKNTFLSIVSPILDNIRNNRGISDYRIEINDTIETRERRELPAKIYFKPYGALEYITIDFVLTPEGASFDDI